MYSLDGVPLDDPDGRWYLHDRTGIRILPGRRSVGASLPGRDGVLPSLGSAYGPGLLNLTLSIRKPSHPEMMAGIEALYGLFSQRHRLMSLVHDYGNGQKREALIEVLSEIQPEKLLMEFSRLDIQCSVPGTFWRDVESADAAVRIAAAESTLPLYAFEGSTGPINDALIRFEGGFSSAVIADPVSGDTLSVNTAVADGECVVVDAANWVARKHASASWSTTTGTDVTALVESNRGSGPMCTLNPEFSAGVGQMSLTVRGTNIVGSPRVTVRAKRSFL